MNIFNWIKQELHPIKSNSTEFIYDKMDSQSDYCLPLIYKPFDADNRTHWRDRGWAFDFLYATGAGGAGGAGGGRLLDFGPGDGWPSLIVAPYINKVIGLDASPKRVEVCTANARRMGITNAEFIHYDTEQDIPFKNNNFDGILAASSVEETNNPKEILNQFYRVLRPGGRLRIFYDSLNKYKNGREHEFWIHPLDKKSCMIILMNRLIKKERIDMYGLIVALTEKDIIRLFTANKQPLRFEDITTDKLKNIRPQIIETKICSIPHPSGKTIYKWLRDSGFDPILPTSNGADTAGQLFDDIPETKRPSNMSEVDNLIRPLVEKAVHTETPIESDPVITAVKPNA